jgi:preprotein translocase subunit SecG
MYGLLLGLHILICVILVLVVLLQRGEAADLAGAFGGGGSQTAFGPRGAATFLSKLTTISAILFMLTSLGLAIISVSRQESVVKKEEKAPITAPEKSEPKTPGSSSSPAERK